MAQTPRGGLYEPPCKGHLEVCSIYSETSVLTTSLFDPGDNPMSLLFFAEEALEEEEEGAEENYEGLMVDPGQPGRAVLYP